MRSDPKPEPRKKKPKTFLKRTPIKKSFRKATGELIFFKTRYIELKGKSQLTDKWLPFDIKHFAHVLSKGSRPDLRLNRNNIVHAEFDFHFSYDNNSKAETLKLYPQSTWVFDLREKLKQTPVEKR